MGTRDLATEVPASSYIIPACAGKQPIGDVDSFTGGADNAADLLGTHVDKVEFWLELPGQPLLVTIICPR